MKNIKTKIKEIREHPIFKEIGSKIFKENFYLIIPLENEKTLLRFMTYNKPKNPPEDIVFETTYPSKASLKREVEYHRDKEQKAIVLNEKFLMMQDSRMKLKHAGYGFLRRDNTRTSGEYAIRYEGAVNGRYTENWAILEKFKTSEQRDDRLVEVMKQDKILYGF